MGKKTVKPKTHKRHASKPTHVEFNGADYPVNVKGSGIDSYIMKKILSQLHAMLTRHSKVILTRLDLHQPHYTPDNKHLSSFLDAEIKRIKRKHNLTRIGYAWTREKETAKAQHYHIALLFDGNTIKNPYRILTEMGERWKFRTDGTHHIPDQATYRLTKSDPNTLADAIYRLSYLAKGRGKGYRAETANDYTTSRIKPKSPCKAI